MKIDIVYGFTFLVPTLFLSDWDHLSVMEKTQCALLLIQNVKNALNSKSAIVQNSKSSQISSSREGDRSIFLFLEIALVSLLSPLCPLEHLKVFASLSVIIIVITTTGIVIVFLLFIGIFWYFRVPQSVSSEYRLEAVFIYYVLHALQALSRS